MTRERLFTTTLEHRPRRSTCTDLVPFPREECLACGGPVRRESIGQPALFRHGGYGGTRMTTFHVCSASKCRCVRVVAVDEVRPDRREVSVRGTAEGPGASVPPGPQIEGR